MTHQQAWEKGLIEKNGAANFLRVPSKWLTYAEHDGFLMPDLVEDGIRYYNRQKIEQFKPFANAIRAFNSPKVNFETWKSKFYSQGYPSKNCCNICGTSFGVN